MTVAHIQRQTMTTLTIVSISNHIRCLSNVLHLNYLVNENLQEHKPFVLLFKSKVNVPNIQ